MTFRILGFLLAPLIFLSGCISAETQQRLDTAEKRVALLQKESEIAQRERAEMELKLKFKPTDVSVEEKSALAAAIARADDASQQARLAREELDVIKQEAKDERFQSGVHFAEIGLAAAGPPLAAAFPILGFVVNILGGALAGLKKKGSVQVAVA